MTTVTILDWLMRCTFCGGNSETHKSLQGYNLLLKDVTFESTLLSAQINKNGKHFSPENIQSKPEIVSTQLA